MSFFDGFKKSAISYVAETEVVQINIDEIIEGSSQNDNFATLDISSSDAFNFVYLILFFTVSSNNVISWLTKEMFSLKDLIEKSATIWPSINISPFWGS